MVAAERFYDAVMDAFGVLKVGSRQDWLGCGERADADHPGRIYIAIQTATGSKPSAITPCDQRRRPACSEIDRHHA
jgi:hypothetical protein